MAARYIDSDGLLAVLPEYIRDKILDDNDDGSEDAGLADTLIEAAADEVDGYLQAAGYSVPLDDSVPASVPAKVKALVRRLARYYAHMRIDAVSNEIAQDYEAVFSELRMIAKGEIFLGISPSPTADSELTAVVYADDRVFTTANLGGPNGI